MRRQGKMIVLPVMYSKHQNSAEVNSLFAETTGNFANTHYSGLRRRRDRSAEKKI